MTVSTTSMDFRLATTPYGFVRRDLSRAKHRHGERDQVSIADPVALAARQSL